MKKSIVLFVFTLATLSFVSCKESAKEEKKEETTVEAKTEESAETKETYACPMDCEKGKTYEAPGKCPVCEMALVSSKEKAEKAEDHEGHDH